MSGQPRPFLAAALDRHARRGGPPSWLASVDRLIALAAPRRAPAVEDLGFTAYRESLIGRGRDAGEAAAQRALDSVNAGLGLPDPAPLCPLQARRALAEPI